MSKASRWVGGCENVKWSKRYGIPIQRTISRRYYNTKVKLINVLVWANILLIIQYYVNYVELLCFEQLTLFRNNTGFNWFAEVFPGDNLLPEHTQCILAIWWVQLNAGTGYADVINLKITIIQWYLNFKPEIGHKCLSV